jgi:hypothetical protein
MRTLAAQRTLAQRAANYFGQGNTSKMRGVKLGQGVYAWVTASQMWIYDEQFSPHGTVVNLSAAMRTSLIDALEGF